MRIVLHLGAHKTATTYIQTVLSENAERLRAAGVGYVPLESMRLAVTPLVERPGSDIGAGPRALVDSHGDCRRVILSDENISGLCSNAVKAGTYYARLRRRAGGLIDALDGDDVEILFALRSYDAFVSSMYCEYLRHRPFLTIEEYLDAVDVAGFSWKPIVAAFADFVSESRVTVWRYEDFPRIEDQVFAALCGEGCPPLQKSRQPVRLSHSQRAIDTLAAMRPGLGRDEIRRQVPIVSAAMPKQADSPAFAAFGDQQAAALRERYDEDFAEIRAVFPAMKILGGEPPSDGGRKAATGDADEPARPDPGRPPTPRRERGPAGATGTRIFVVSLAGSAERRRRFARRASDARIAWQFFDAQESLDEELVYRPEEARLHSGRELEAGELACYSSHHALWRHLLADEASQYMILEDDVIADWEMLALVAGVDLAASGIPLLRLYGKAPAPFWVRRRRWLTRTSHLIEFKRTCWGTQGYVITRSAAESLVDHARRAVRPIDDQIDRVCDHGIPSLCLFPFPLIEETRGSTIGNERFAARDRSLARKAFVAKDLVRQRLARLRRALHSQDWTARPFAGEDG